MRSPRIRVPITWQAERLLKQLAQRGIYGRSLVDVAARFIDEGLQRLTGPGGQLLADNGKRGTENE